MHNLVKTGEVGRVKEGGGVDAAEEGEVAEEEVKVEEDGVVEEGEEEEEEAVNVNRLKRILGFL